MKILKYLFKFIGVGLLDCFIIIIVSILIRNLTGFKFNDVLFCIGILSLFISLFSIIGGNPKGLSMQGMGQTNAQYISNFNLAISKFEKKIKDTIILKSNSILLILASIICIIISFLSN